MRMKLSLWSVILVWVRVLFLLFYLERNFLFVMMDSNLHWIAQTTLTSRSAMRNIRKLRSLTKLWSMVLLSMIAPGSEIIRVNNTKYQTHSSCRDCSISTPKSKLFSWSINRISVRPELINCQDWPRTCWNLLRLSRTSRQESMLLLTELNVI